MENIIILSASSFWNLERNVPEIFSVSKVVNVSYFHDERRVKKVIDENSVEEIIQKVRNLNRIYKVFINLITSILNVVKLKI